MKYFNILLIAFLATFTLAACDTNEGPMEETGETVDESVESTQDAAEDALDSAGDTVE